MEGREGGSEKALVVVMMMLMIMMAKNGIDIFLYIILGEKGSYWLVGNRREMVEDCSAAAAAAAAACNLRLEAKIQNTQYDRQSVILQ